MLEPVYTNRFKKEYALAVKRGKNMGKIKTVMEMLINEQPLPPERQDHPLHGEYAGARECHIQGDWILVYEIDRTDQSVTFAHTGTHSDLF